VDQRSQAGDGSQEYCLSGQVLHSCHPPTNCHPSNVIDGVEEEKTKLRHKHQTFQIDIGFITSFVNFLFYVAIFTKFGRIAEFKVLPAMALKVSFLRAILALLSPNDWDPLAPWVPNRFA